MSNMSYCRFENTYRDLLDCSGSLDDDLSESELMFRKEIIKLCVEIAIDYGYDVGMNLVDEGSYN